MYLYVFTCKTKLFITVIEWSHSAWWNMVLQTLKETLDYSTWCNYFLLTAVSDVSVLPQRCRKLSKKVPLVNADLFCYPQPPKWPTIKKCPKSRESVVSENTELLWKNRKWKYLLLLLSPNVCILKVLDVIQPNNDDLRAYTSSPLGLNIDTRWRTCGTEYRTNVKNPVETVKKEIWVP